MKIKRIQVENFKSFNRLDIDLRDFNIVIGANASGKSNFIHILEFIRDIEMHGLENAVSLQGGSEYLRNIKMAADHNLSVEITYKVNGLGLMPITSIGSPHEMEKPEITYRFALGFPKSKPEIEIVEDEL
jgi:AAA15 family ATPase/GTPase